MLKQYERTGNWFAAPSRPPPGGTGRRKTPCAPRPDLPGPPDAGQPHPRVYHGPRPTDGEGPFFQPWTEAFPGAAAAHRRETDRREPASVTADGRRWLPFRAFALRDRSAPPRPSPVIKRFRSRQTDLLT
ncbi:hypothetical protein TPA0907_02420 [Micromonospora humidisoli]|nr:hypothetical protein TPA0907_02420 [Micromonospora sp. AKA109]